MNNTGRINMKTAISLIFLLLAIFTALPCIAAEKTDRASRARQRMQSLFGKVTDPLADTDPDFTAMRDRLIHGEIACESTLSERQRALVTLAALTAVDSTDGLAVQVRASLAGGLPPSDIKEALYQLAPYVGFPKVEHALIPTNAVFREQGIALPVESQATVTEESRFADGLRVQKAIFGNAIDAMHENTPDDQKALMKNYLSAFCFGDIYTRTGLDLKERELLTFCAVSILGGCENQVKAHVNGNAAVGNSRKLLIDAISQCLPYMGFPRALNALACVNAVYP